MERNRLLMNLMYYALICFVIALSIYLVIFTQTEGRACGKNPFIYGSAKMGDVVCDCYQMKDGIMKTFRFNDTGFFSTKTYDNDIKMPVLNITLSS